MTTTIIINEVLQSYIDPLTASEYAVLERSLQAEGCRDALVLWRGVLIDGHHRHAICLKHAIPFATLENTSFESIDDVKLWMIDNHLARRSVSDFQRGELALRKKDIVAAKFAQRQQLAAQPESESEPELQPTGGTRDEVAKLARLSSNTISQIERIQKAATPELVAAVRSGTISINAAATVASLPEAQQLAAVAGGKKQMQQAAREVREQKAALKALPEAALEVLEVLEAVDAVDALEAVDATEVEQLRAEIATLQQGNAVLKLENAALEARMAALLDAQ
jgi:hypothetical protein